MAEEQTSTPPSSTEGGQEQQPQAAPTLESVYQQYGIEDQAAQFQQARQQQAPQQQPAPQQQTPSVPDPVIDPQGYQRHQAQEQQDRQSLRQTLHHVVNQLQAQQANAIRQQEEADIKRAVSVLKEKVPGVDDDMLEVYLGAKARKDPKFMSLWQQRTQKPEAWSKALDAVASEAGSKFGAQRDPQLTENTRAMKAAAQAASTTRQDGSERKLNDDPGKFQQEWDSLVNNNTY